LTLTVFTQINFVSDFLQVKCNLDGKRPFCVFIPYDDHLRLIGKPVVDFMLVLIGFFLLGVTAEGLRADMDKNRRF